MNKVLMFALIAGFAGIMVAGASIPAIADGQGKGNDDGKGNPDQGLAGCENSQGKAAQNNPHCTADDDGDGVPNWQDACPTESGTGDGRMSTSINS